MANTDAYTFIDVFTKPLLIDDKEVELKEIKIPIIQRDYAQGRTDADTMRVRTRFVDALYKAVTETPITLDFVYGDIKDGVMTPLDGQQRLTTLFLLHWYIAKKEQVAEEESSFLTRFSYMTRYSARDFCSYIYNNFTPDFSDKHKPLSEQIVDQSWFPLDWKKDPTISSMLVMLNTIDSVFGGTSGIWEKLKTDAITFYFLSIHGLGLTDEIYIKMNSRGKPLTLFEHFKAELEREMKLVSVERCKDIMEKIDLAWTDMLWKYCVHRTVDADGNELCEVDIIDDKFLRYFRFVCDILCYQAGGTPQGKVIDEFKLVKEYFSTENENALANMQQLEKYFDCWCNIKEGMTPLELAEKYISTSHEPGKIKLENRYEIDIFKDCINTYADRNGRNRRFPLGRIVMLFAFVTYLLNQDKISDDDFARRLRIVNNLILNSEDEISDSESRQSGNRMPNILKQIESIVINGEVDDTIEKSLNTYQLSEEKEKLVWTNVNADKTEDLFTLEDHMLLQGQIWILGLDNIALGQKFTSLFTCDWNLIDLSLMTCGNYSQKENRWRYQIGTGNTRVPNAWRTLFHKSQSSNSEGTRACLVKLLNKHEALSNDVLQADIDAFLKECEESNIFDWRYYYVKYDVFHPSSYGKYCWKNYASDPYDFVVLTTPKAVSEYAYQPFLKAVKDDINKEDREKSLLLGDKYVRVDKASYVIFDSVTHDEIERIVISQNENGIDTENRIEKLKTHLGL